MSWVSSSSENCAFGDARVNRNISSGKQVQKILVPEGSNSETCAERTDVKELMERSSFENESSSSHKAPVSLAVGGRRGWARKECPGRWRGAL